jgi:hypothetical protein
MTAQRDDARVESVVDEVRRLLADCTVEEKRRVLVELDRWVTLGRRASTRRRLLAARIDAQPPVALYCIGTVGLCAGLRWRFAPGGALPLCPWLIVLP